MSPHCKAFVRHEWPLRFLCWHSKDGTAWLQHSNDSKASHSMEYMTAKADTCLVHIWPKGNILMLLPWVPWVCHCSKKTDQHWQTWQTWQCFLALQSCFHEWRTTLNHWSWFYLHANVCSWDNSRVIKLHTQVNSTYGPNSKTPETRYSGVSKS